MPNVAWNPADSWTDLVFSNDDTTATKTVTGSYCGVRGTVSYGTGLRYFEAIVPGGGEGSIGLATAAASLDQPLGYGSSEGLGIYNDGTMWIGGSGYGSSEGALENTRVGFLIDLDARKVWVKASNGNWSHGGDPTSGGAGIDISHITTDMYPMFTGFYTDDSSTLYSDTGTITLGLPSGASLWGDSGSTPTPTPTRKPIRSVCWF
jgi:hypothetical protein